MSNNPAPKDLSQILAAIALVSSALPACAEVHAQSRARRSRRTDAGVADVVRVDSGYRMDVATAVGDVPFVCPTRDTHLLNRTRCVQPGTRCYGGMTSCVCNALAGSLQWDCQSSFMGPLPPPEMA